MSPERCTPMQTMTHTADHAQSVGSSTSDAQLNSDTEQDEREATELHDYHGTSSDERVVVDGSAAPTARSRSTTSGSPSTIKTFWARHVVATVPHEACRDHFGTSVSCRCCYSFHHG